MTHEPREEERARGRTRSRTQDSGDRSQDSASRAVSRRPRRAKPLGHEDNVRIHRPRSRAAERLPSPVQGAAVSSAEGWGCTPHTPRFTQHRCTHPASLSIAAHTPLHSASLHTHRFTQHRCTHTASLSIAAHTPDCSHRLADPRTPFPSTQKKKPLFPHFPEGKARI